MLFLGFVFSLSLVWTAKRTRHSGASTISSITFLRLFLFEFYACLTREIQLKSHCAHFFLFILFLLLFDGNAVNHKYMSFNGLRWLKIYPSRITRLNRLPCLFNLFSFVCLFLISQRPCFVFRHPTVLERNVFLTPFSKYVWYCIVASGCLIICIAVVISYREMKNYYRRPGKWYFNGNELLWRAPRRCYWWPSSSVACNVRPLTTSVCSCSTI